MKMTNGTAETRTAVIRPSADSALILRIIAKRARITWASTSSTRARLQPVPAWMLIATAR